MSKEEMREGFEAWHCEQYKTKHTTGEPTRDMHNGVRDESYCSNKSQVLWECWQSTGGDVAKVEALKDEIEQKEAGQKPVGYLDRIPGNGFGFRSIKCSPHAYYKIPVYTRSESGEVERLKQEILVARAQGRAEAVEIIVALEAEGGLDEYIGSHTIGCTGEYGSHWKEDDLRELLRVDAPAASELESCRYNSYEIIHLEEERDTLLAKLAEREAQLSKATTFVQGLCNSAGSQPSVATGYLRDILDALQERADLSSSAEPSAPQRKPATPNLCTSCDNCRGFITGHDSSEQKPYSICCENCGKKARAHEHAELAEAWNEINPRTDAAVNAEPANKESAQ